MTLWATAIAMGMATGILSGLMGVGGGVILVPMLAVFLGIPQHTAQGISMIVIIPTAIAGIMHLMKEKLVNYRVAGFLALGAVCGSLISANFVQYIPGDALKKIFGIFVIFTGIRMILAKPKQTK
ncbi:MAG: sulfite exporter TauE/SafE family protein [Negativicutes bacterium]|nr:sulfite exporter TauE/SafE family protein [Negativicutes bacterium]